MYSVTPSKPYGNPLEVMTACKNAAHSLGTVRVRDARLACKPYKIHVLPLGPTDHILRRISHSGSVAFWGPVQAGVQKLCTSGIAHPALVAERAEHIVAQSDKASRNFIEKSPTAQVIHINTSNSTQVVGILYPY